MNRIYYLSPKEVQKAAVSPMLYFFFFCQPPPVPGNDGPGHYEKSAVLKSSHEIPIVKKGQSSGICAEYCDN